jgi:hypothetical protein
LYQLLEQGRIRSKALCDPGKKRGSRLFHLQSILDLIESCEEADEQGLDGDGRASQEREARQ